MTELVKTPEGFECWEYWDDGNCAKCWRFFYSYSSMVWYCETTTLRMEFVESQDSKGWANIR